MPQHYLLLVYYWFGFTEKLPSLVDLLFIFGFDFCSQRCWVPLDNSVLKLIFHFSNSLWCIVLLYVRHSSFTLLPHSLTLSLYSSVSGIGPYLCVCMCLSVTLSPTVCVCVCVLNLKKSTLFCLCYAWIVVGDFTMLMRFPGVLKKHDKLLSRFDVIVCKAVWRTAAVSAASNSNLILIFNI